MSVEAPASPPPSITDEELEDKLKIQVVDVSDAVQANAVDYAEQRLSEQTGQRGIRGFLRKVWQGNIARDFYRQREIQRGRRAITETGNLYVMQGGEQADHDVAMTAVVERFASDYMHEGETNQQFEDAAHGQQLMGQLQELVRNYAQTGMTYEALVEERTRILAEYGHQVHETDRNRGLVFADNVLEVAAQARLAFEHEVGLDRIDAAISGRMGEARIGVRTEAHNEMTDRILDRLHSTPISLLANETALGIGVATAMTIGKFTTRKLAYAFAKWGTLGLGAGVISGAREHHRVGQERTAHSRGMAEGGQIEEGSSRREQMEATRYETVPASVLTENLQAALGSLDSENPDSIRALAAALSEADARVRLSDTEAQDFVSYSAKTSVETERLNLDIELARARTAFSDLGDTTAITGLGLDGLTQSLVDHLDEDVEAKDSAFRTLRRHRVIRMGLIGAATGMVAGLGIQEIDALLDHGLQGVAEGVDGSNRHTLLADIFRHHSDNQANHWQRQPFEGGHHFHDTAVDMPPGYHLVDVNKGQEFGWQIQDSHGNNVLDKLDWSKWQQLVGQDHGSEHLHHISEGHTGVGFDKEGNLDHDTREALRELGWNLHQHHINFHEPHIVSSSVERSPQEYLLHHPEEFTQVHRDLWYDNNTPGVSDDNELKLWWGGATGSGIDSQGDYVFNVGHMTPDGSFHDGLSANAQQLLHEGKLKLALSMTKGTQHYVHLEDISSDSNAITPHDSYFAHSLFENQNGHARLTGAYAEVVQVMGKNPDGSENIRVLATAVGDNSPHAAHDIVNHMVREAHTHYVTYMEAPKATPIEIPPVLPVYSRRGLETLATTETTPNYYYGLVTAEQRREWEKQRSPRLRENPDADLDTGDELRWYRSQIRKRRGAEYLREVDSNIENDPVLKKISKEIKALVCMPVRAETESGNIYKTLSLYAQQSEKSKRQTAIVLNVNWQEASERDPAKMEQIKKTLSEIERAKRDFPDLQIASFQKRWSDEFLAKRKGQLYGEVIKILYDTAALAVERAIREGRRDDVDEALLITNDADAEGLRRDYLEKYISALDKDSSVDVFTGIIRWGTREFKEYPGYGVVSGVYATLNMMTQRRENKKQRGVSTTGPNSAFRLSVYAATGGCEDRLDLGAGADAILGQRVVAARLDMPSGGRRLLRRGGSGYKGVSGLGGPLRSTERTVIQHVAGAQIDSMGDRLLGAYRRGQWIANGWIGFNSGGYESRTVSGSTASLEPENIDRDIEEIAHRVEVNVEGFGKNWFTDRAVISSAMALFFGTADKSGNKLYDLRFAPDGRLESFKFTPAGKKHLKNRLMRDSRGRFDYYGSRIRRKLYSELPQGSNHELRVATPRFVAHTT